jgi:hypothetical protein
MLLLADTGFSVGWQLPLVQVVLVLLAALAVGLSLLVMSTLFLLFVLGWKGDCALHGHACCD